MIDKINAIVLPVRDVRSCALFYRDKLGFTLSQLETDEAYLTLGASGGTVLALKSHSLLSKEISEERINRGEDVVKTIHCVAFVGDIEQEHKDLVQKGVHFVDAPHAVSDGWRTAHFEDPEGNLWEIAQGPKR